VKPDSFICHLVGNNLTTVAPHGACSAKTRLWHHFLADKVVSFVQKLLRSVMKEMPKLAFDVSPLRFHCHKTTDSKL
jgi:hypothetical protein